MKSVIKRKVPVKSIMSVKEKRIISSKLCPFINYIDRNKMKMVRILHTATQNTSPLTGTWDNRWLISSIMVQSLSNNFRKLKSVENEHFDMIFDKSMNISVKSINGAFQRMKKNIRYDRSHIAPGIISVLRVWKYLYNWPLTTTHGHYLFSCLKRCCCVQRKYFMASESFDELPPRKVL